MSPMQMMAPTASITMVLMSGAMMAAMMLPSIAPNVWRYHHRLRAMGVAHPGRRTTLFASGYASVWTAIGLVLPALPAFHLASWAAASAILCAGALQRSGWKAKQLLRCRVLCVSELAPKNAMTVWLEGCRLGVDCCLSCAAPMAVLFVAGLMDPRVMLTITAAITAERVAPAGARIARLTGGLALVAGSWLLAVVILNKA